MSRTRTTTLALTAAALLAPAGAALAAPGQPSMDTLSAFSTGPNRTVGWSPVLFTLHSGDRNYQVSATDLSVGGTDTTSVAASATDATLALVNGHEYAIKVRARERACLTWLNPPGICLLYSPGYTSGAWSDERVTRVDATSPAGSIQIAGGAEFTSSPAIELTLDAADPPSNGYPSSGIDGVQLHETNAFPCAILVLGGDTSGCTQAFLGTKPYTLAPGPDGPRTVFARFRDKARSHHGFIITLGPVGNGSSIVSDSIVLDTLAPTPKLSQSATTVPPGTAVSFNAQTSADGAAGPNDSGVDPDSFAWQFGDGTSGTGPTVSHTYPGPGTYNGTLGVRDRAGNGASLPFSVTVAAPGQAATQAGGAGAGAGAGASTKVKKLTLGKIVALTKFRALQTARVRIAVSKRTRLAGTLLKKTPSGKPVAVRRFGKTGGPGKVVMSFRAAKAGRYVVKITGGGLTRTLPIRVR